MVQSEPSQAINRLNSSHRVLSQVVVFLECIRYDNAYGAPR
jgi:hypothetical protein